MTVRVEPDGVDPLPLAQLRQPALRVVGLAAGGGQIDLLAAQVRDHRPRTVALPSAAAAEALTAELSAMGVAHLAGIAEGIFTFAGLSRMERGGRSFAPALDKEARAAKRIGWRRAVARSLGSVAPAEP